MLWANGQVEIEEVQEVLAHLWKWRTGEEYSHAALYGRMCVWGGRLRLLPLLLYHFYDCHHDQLTTNFKILKYAGSGNWRPGAQTVQGSVDQIRVKSWKTGKVRVAPPGCQIVDPPEQGLLPKTSSSGDLQTVKLTNGNIEVEVMSIFVCSNHELEQCSRSDTAITSNINIARAWVPSPNLP